MHLSFNIVRSGVTAITPKDIDSSKLISHSKIAGWYCHLFLMEVRQCVKCSLTKIWFYETLLTDNMLPNIFFFFLMRCCVYAPEKKIKIAIACFFETNELPNVLFREKDNQNGLLNLKAHVPKAFTIWASALIMFYLFARDSTFN